MKKIKPLSDMQKLNIVRIVHTAIWGVFVAAILYVCYAGIFDRVGKFTWFCIVLVLIECVVLLINRWKCPLTSLAYKYTNTHPVGFDIFLPRWLAQHNKILFSSLFIVGVFLVLWRTL